jgi:uncharacterized RDD family membrane protein YckC
MKCQNCEYENLKRATFCGVCGADLKIEEDSREAKAEPLEDSVGQEEPSLAAPVFVYQPPTGLVDETSAIDDTPLCFAGAWRRFFATWFDNLILGFSGVIFFIFTPFGKSVLMQMGSRNNPSIFQPAVILTSLLGFVIIFAYGTFFMGKFGGTPGQKILGMKTLSCSMGNLSELGYAKAFFRTAVYQVLNILPIIDFFVTTVSIFTVIFSKKHQAIHDMICNTVVVKRRPVM